MSTLDLRVKDKYFYRHTNGTLQQKPAFVVDTGGGPNEYFDSPFVKHWWFGQEKDEPNE